MAINLKRHRHVSCAHGITDSVKILCKTIIENYEEQRRIIIYNYKCDEHNRNGNHSMEADMPRPGTTKPCGT